MGRERKFQHQNLNDVPAYAGFSIGFVAKLLFARIAMLLPA